MRHEALLRAVRSDVDVTSLFSPSVKNHHVKYPSSCHPHLPLTQGHPPRVWVPPLPPQPPTPQATPSPPSTRLCCRGVSVGLWPPRLPLHVIRTEVPAGKDRAPTGNERAPSIGRSSRKKDLSPQGGGACASGEQNGIFARYEDTFWRGCEFQGKRKSLSGVQADAQTRQQPRWPPGFM